MRQPLVTIACITYNHGPFIRQCLDGFLMQKVDFDYEIVVHDDASTDDTAEILKEYQARHADKIKLILRSENTYQMGVTKIFYHNIIKHSKAKYIATCEGDDYWVDEYKLSKQVGFLEENQDYNVSVARVHKYFEKSGETVTQGEFDWLFTKPFLTLKDYLKTFFSQTSTYVFRREGYDMPHYCNYFHGEDILMIAIATKESKIKFHDEYMATYRIHGGGVTQQRFHPKMHYLDIYNYAEAINTLTDYKYRTIIKSIHWRLYLDYRYKTARLWPMKYVYTLLSKVNNYLRYYVL